MKTISLFPSCSQLLDLDDKCILSVPLSTSGPHYSRWQSGGICQVLSTEAFTLFFHDVPGIKESFLSFFVPSVMESCSRVCLLVVFRLLGQTVRHFASVCSCHRDSLTRRRLAIVQEAVRVFFFSVSSIGSARDDICPVVSGSLREMSLQAMLKYEGPATLFKLLFTLSSFPCICTIFDHLFGIRLGALEMCYILVR